MENDTSKPPTSPPTSPPFEMASPFPAPQRPIRGRTVTVWTIVGAIAVGALKWFLASHGVPAPVVDEAAQQITNVLPK